MDEKNDYPLASEMYADLKETNMFLRKLLVGAIIAIALLVVALAGTNIYHIYQWSQFDTYVVDSGDGGYANFVQGDNTGNINNGTDSGKNPPDGQLQGD